MSKDISKKFVVPHVYIILLSIAFITMLLTHIIPAGKYEFVKNAMGRSVVAPDTFQFIESTPQGIFDFFRAVPKGLAETAEIVFFLFLVGGSFAVVEATGAIEAALGKITVKMAGKEKLIIPVVMLVFSLGGATFGMAEETLPFIPIMVSLTVALGFDSLTGAGVVLAGAGAGFAGAFLNPFTVGVGQGIAGLPLFSGMPFRIVLYICMATLTIGYVYRYAGKIKDGKIKSSMYEVDKDRDEVIDINNIKPITTKHIYTLVVVGVTIVTFTYGVLKLGWYLQELSAIFLAMGFVCAIVSGMGLNKFAENLSKGMAGMATGAIVVGIARATLVIMTDGHIIDTILYYASQLLGNLPATLASVGMYIFQCFLNFLVPSGSGQAAISLPILAPLSDLVGVTRQTAVLAYQLGDGISNVFTPTSGYFMAGLALAKIPWNKWAKWMLPLLLMQYALGAIFVIIATLIKYGPF